MWTKNFENLINGRLWTNEGSSSSNDTGVTTPFSVIDMNGTVESPNFRSSSGIYGYYGTELGFLSGFSYSDGSLSTVGTSTWVVKNPTDTNFANDHLSYWYIYVGSSNTAETSDDTSITAIGGITGVGSYVSSSARYNSSTNSFDIIVSPTIVSSNDESVEIKEIGMYKRISTLASQGYYANILLYRKVLDTPIVLQPNQPATVTFQISLPRITLA